MGVMIAIACICIRSRTRFEFERPLDPEAEAADAAEELDHAEASASASPVITAIVIDTDTIGRHLSVFLWWLFSKKKSARRAECQKWNRDPKLELSANFGILRETWRGRAPIELRNGRRWSGDAAGHAIRSNRNTVKNATRNENLRGFSPAFVRIEGQLTEQEASPAQ